MSAGSGTSGANLEGLVRRARQGDAQAFLELYGQLQRRVLGLCRHLLGSPEAAEDAASEVFLRAQRAMRTYDSALPFPGWVVRIAANYCVDVLRRRKVESRLFLPYEQELADPPEPNPSPLSQLLSDEERTRVRSAVERLAERYRLPLVLRFYSEMSYDEIAATLGLTRNHVATLIFRAKGELRRTLAPAAKERVQ